MRGVFLGPRVSRSGPGRQKGVRAPGPTARREAQGRESHPALFRLARCLYFVLQPRSQEGEVLCRVASRSFQMMRQGLSQILLREPGLPIV